MAEKECMVSVLCTAYNHEEYIAQTLQCIVDQQTDFAFELLVNDDASTDGTAAIIRKFEEKYPHIIRAFYQKDNLYSQHKNAYEAVLFAESRGKYIAFCEGDDYWSDMTKLQRQVDFMEDHPEYSGCVHDTMRHYCLGNAPDKRLIGRDDDFDPDIDKIARGTSYSWHTSSILAKAWLFSELPEYFHIGWDHAFLDHPIGLWMMFNGPVHYIGRCMSVYRLDSSPSAWSTGVDGQYEKLRKYTEGECRVLESALKTAPVGFRSSIEYWLREREFELMYIEGRDREQRRPPYDAILRRQPLSYRVNNFLKSFFPGLHKLYRHMRGYRS